MSPAQTVSKVFAFRQGADSAYGPLYVTPAQGRDGDLYGTTAGDRYPTNLGDIFRVSTSGVGTTLYNFSGTAESYPYYGLILATDGNFYGTVTGGSANMGALFRITPDGVYAVVYNFQGLDDGAYPSLLTDPGLRRQSVWRCRWSLRSKRRYDLQVQCGRVDHHCLCPER